MTSPLPTPRKVATYPIAGEPKAGALFLYGEPNASRIAILCAGYPDDHENFQPFASRLAEKAGCLVGVTCLPGYDDRKDWPYGDNKADGYSFEEMTGAMREAVKTLRKESTYKGKGEGGGAAAAKLFAVFHDWGVAPGMMYANRTIEEGSEDLVPDRIVLFDVLGGPHPDTKDMPIVPKDTFYITFVTLAYRILLASSFAIRRYVSKILAPMCLIPGFMVLGALRLSPTLEIDAKVHESRRTPLPLDRMIYMAYPYFYMFKSLFTGKMKEDFHGMSLPPDLTKTPVLYMYGTEKRIMFHDMRALKVLEREAEEGRKSKVVAVDKAGHWLYLQQPDICYEEVAKFIADA